MDQEITIARVRRQPLPKRVWILSWVSLFADVASEMVYPIIPIFLTTVVGAPVAALGSVEGFAEAIVSFMKGVSGWHSDRSGKRVGYVQLGYGLSALGKPLLALAQSWLTVFGARSLDRFGKGLRTTARDALIADSVDKADYGRAFGLHRAMDTAGAFLGGVVALILLETVVFKADDLRKLFYIAAIPGLISVALTFILRDAPKSAAEPGEEGRSGVRHLPPAYWRAMGISLVFGLANSSDTFLLLRANGLFSDELKRDPGAFGGLLTTFGHNAVAFGAPLVMTTLAYLLYNITYVGFSYPAGVLSDRIGRWPLLTVGFILYAVVYAGFGFATTGLLWLLFALYGVYIGLTDGVRKALVAENAPPDAKGTALGLFYMASGFTTLAGNIVAGWLWDSQGPKATFLFGSAVAVLAVLLIPLTAGIKRGTTSAS